MGSPVKKAMCIAGSRWELHPRMSLSSLRLLRLKVVKAQHTTPGLPEHHVHAGANTLLCINPLTYSQKFVPVMSS